MKIIIIFLLIFVVFLISCQVSEPEETVKEPVKEPITLTELQATACNTAHEEGSCDSRLGEVGIVLKTECCEALGKCC